MSLKPASPLVSCLGREGQGMESAGFDRKLTLTIITTQRALFNR